MPFLATPAGRDLAERFGVPSQHRLDHRPEDDPAGRGEPFNELADHHAPRAGTGAPRPQLNLLPLLRPGRPLGAHMDLQDLRPASPQGSRSPVALGQVGEHGPPDELLGRLGVEPQGAGLSTGASQVRPRVADRDESEGVLELVGAAIVNPPRPALGDLQARGRRGQGLRLLAELARQVLVGEHRGLAACAAKVLARKFAYNLQDVAQTGFATVSRPAVLQECALARVGLDVHAAHADRRIRLDVERVHRHRGAGVRRL